MAYGTVTLNPGAAGNEVATDDIGGSDFQRVKLALGAEGAAVDAVAGAGAVGTGVQRVTLASDDPGVAAMEAVQAAVEGTLTVASHEVTNGGTFAVQVNGAALTSLQLLDNVVAVEDAAAGSGYSGIPFLAVRQDSHSDLAADGDFISPTIDADGGLRVSIVAGAGSGGTAAADDADFTAGTTSGTPVMGSYQSSPTAVTDGDMGIIGITANREVKVSVTSGGVTGAAIDTATGGTDEGVISIFTRDDALSTLTPAEGDNVQGRTNARGALWVALDSTAAQTVTLAAGTATNEVVGDAAHGAAAAGNPLLTGLEGRSTAPTAVDDGDVVRALATLLGKQVVLPYALPANTWSYASAAAVTDTSDDEAKAAVASTRNYVTGIQVFNGHDTTGTEVVIKDGATVLWRGWAEQTGGGCSAKFDPPLRGTANTAINVANITNSSSTYFNLQGYAATE